MRDAIVNGTLAPGARLNELKLMRELSSSRSPVREAIRMLEARGLVTVEPHRGARVWPVSETELEEIFDVPADDREPRPPARRPPTHAGHATAPLRRAVDEARAALAAGTVSRWHEASVRFHDGLVALAGNRHLVRLHEALKTSGRSQIPIIGPSGEPERFQAEPEATSPRIIAFLDVGPLTVEEVCEAVGRRSGTR